jgi:uncharacterized oxidoreductase
VPTFTAEHLNDACIDLLCACGASEDEARIVVRELIESSLMGYDSHGVMRAVQYARELRAGRIHPGAPITIVKETASTALVDCNMGFGAVGAQYMAALVVDKARTCGIASVVSMNCHHVGRLGAWVRLIAQDGLIGLAFANHVKSGHIVTPWGGREGRIGTNPLAYAVPRRNGLPLMMDMSTCMIPEGKLRVALHSGKPAPAGCIIDADGNPTTDPQKFYGPPRGAILPFGGSQGYKGFGLALLVEVLGSMLAGYAASEDYKHVNGLCLIAVDPEVYCGAERFLDLVEDLCAYETHVPPAAGFDEVMMPGTPDDRMKEKRLREGIPLPDETCRQMIEVAAQAGLTLQLHPMELL